MNSVQLTGRLTRDPEVRYTDNGHTIARFTLAVDRQYKSDNGPTADFINCKAFGKTAEFIEKYFWKGKKMELVGSIQTGSYTNQDGAKVYTTDVIAQMVAFAESKGSESAVRYPATPVLCCSDKQRKHCCFPPVFSQQYTKL